MLASLKVRWLNLVLAANQAFEERKKPFTIKTTSAPFDGLRMIDLLEDVDTMEGRLRQCSEV